MRARLMAAKIAAVAAAIAMAAPAATLAQAPPAAPPAGPNPAMNPGWMGKSYATSMELYEAMKAKAHGGTKMTWDKLPDWTGLWTRGPGGLKFNYADPDSAHASASLTPEYEAMYRKKLADVAKGLEWDNLSYCLPAGYPRWLTEPFLREFILRPEQVWWAEEQQAEVRRIYTDGRGHMPEDEAYPLWEGDSIGFWDGDTLVVHTNHIKGGQYQRSQPDYSDQTTTVERIHKSDANTIDDEVWVYDPASLTKPWHVLFKYTRVTTPGLRINHWSCEENNNVVRAGSGATDFVLPGEAGYKDPNNLSAQQQKQ